MNTACRWCRMLKENFGPLAANCSAHRTDEERALMQRGTEAVAEMLAEWTALRMVGADKNPDGAR